MFILKKILKAKYSFELPQSGLIMDEHVGDDGQTSGFQYNRRRLKDPFVLDKTKISFNAIFSYLCLLTYTMQFDSAHI